MIWIAGLGLIGATRSSAEEPPRITAQEQLIVVPLPAQIRVIRVGLNERSSDEWTAAACATVDSAVRETIDQSIHFSGRELPPITPEERAAIDEFLAVATLVQMQVHGKSGLGVAKVPRMNIDRTIGSSLSFLSDRTGADYALGVVGLQLEQSQGLAAFSAVGAVASVLLPPLLVPPSVTSSFAALLLIDLRTGELRWLNRRSGYEVSGYNFTDLRDPKSVRDVLRDLLEPYPEIPALRGAQPKSPAATGMSVQMTSPRQGEFEFRAPADWRIREGERNLISATRDGGLLNELAVELRDHSQAFPGTGRQSSRKSSPDQLVEWYVAELRSMRLDDLRIIETSVTAQLAGRAAFRVRFSYRLPVHLGGARVEQMTIGAAVPHGLLLSKLSAPQLNYFEKALPSFEESTGTIVLKRRNYVQ